MSQLLVTGLWDLGWDQRELERLKTSISDTLAMFPFTRLIVHYDAPWIIDYFREEGFVHGIQIIGCHKPIEQLPSQAYLEEFIKRTQLYAVNSREPEMPVDCLDKAFFLYSTVYARKGEQFFHRYLATKLSKIELMAGLATDPNIGECVELTWINPDLSRKNLSRAEIDQILSPSRYLSLYHFRSDYHYMGQPIETASYAMSSGRYTWLEHREAYHFAIEQLDMYPYLYDEEVVMEFMRAQDQERFQNFSLDGPSEIHQKFG